MKRNIFIIFAFLPLILQGQNTVGRFNSGVWSFQGKAVSYTPPIPFDGYYSIMSGDDYFASKNTSELTPLGTGQDTAFYVSMWVWIDSDQIGHGLFAKSGEYIAYINTSQQIVFDIFDKNNANQGRRTGNISANYDKWIHLIFTYDGSGSNAGIDIYLDGIAIDAANRGVTFTNMENKNTDLWIGRYSIYYEKGKLMDYRLGVGALSAQNITDLGNHDLLGTETQIIPFCEGYGDIAHNVVDNNIIKNAYLAAGGNIWNADSIETQFEYIQHYGATKVNDYVFPKLTNKISSFTRLGGYLMGGQSNQRGLAENANLTGGDTIILELKDNVYAYNNSGVYNTYKSELFRGTDVFFGHDATLANKIDSANLNSFFIKYGVDNTYLYDTIGFDDWNVNNVNELYTDIRTFTIEGMTRIFEHGRNPYLKSFSWIHGEKDGTTNTAQLDYEQNLNDLVDSINLITNSVNNVQLPRLSSKVGVTYLTEMRGYQTNFVSTYSDADLINTDNYEFTTIPELHYNHNDMFNLSNVIYNNTISISGNSNFLDVIFPEGYTIENINSIK